MKLRSISAVGLKGPNFSHQLSDATAIIGPNAVGKTRILQAIRLALGGYLPECGKTTRATWELASGPELEVRVEFDDGTDVHRRFWIEGTTIKATCQCREPVGVYETLPLLNAEAYFELTDSQRTEYVFERIKLPDTYTSAAIIAECHRLSLEEGHSEVVEVAKVDLINEVNKHFSPGGSIQDGLVAAIEELRERFTYWNKRAKETIGAVKTLTELKLRENECSTDTIKDLDRQMAEKQTELDRLNSLKGEMTAKRDEAERTKGRIRQLKERLSADQIDYPRVIARVDELIEAEEAKRIPCSFDGTILREELVGLRLRHRTKSHAFSARGETINEAMHALELLEDATDCPYCHSKSKGWKDKLTAELQRKIDPLAEEQQTARLELESIDDNIITTERAIENFDEAVKVNSAVAAEVKRLSGLRATHVEAASKEEARRTELGEELSALNMIPVEEDLGAEIATIEGKRVEVAKGLSALNGRKTAAVQLEQDLKRAAQAELEHQDAAAHVLVIKAVANLLKEKREAMIEEAFADLLTIANTVTRGILKTDLCLYEGTVGMWNGGKFVPHRVFSGTEKALAYIAIAVALSSTAPLKLVILDEFGRLDEENQYKVLLRLAILVAEEVIDQFIIVGTSLPDLKTSSIHLEVIKVKP